MALVGSGKEKKILKSGVGDTFLSEKMDVSSLSESG
jgi:hypothetical protein